MIDEAIERLLYLTNTIPDLLSEIGKEKLSLKITDDKWSKKEIIGHLIDSATINHYRLVCGQFENEPEINYNQNK